MFKTSGLVSDYNNFSNLRIRCKFLSKKDYLNYINKIQTNLKINPYTFWKFINSKRRNNFLPNCMHLNTEEFNTPDDIINTFANYFSSVYENCDYFNVNFKQLTPPKVLSSSLHSCSIDLFEVFEALVS